MAYVLRHNPAAAGLELDESDWIRIPELIEGMNRYGYAMTAADLDAIVNQPDKKRYEIRDGQIRAAQGHSVPVDLELEAKTPPALLFHGTVDRFLPSILEHGLRKGERNHVHLSADRQTAATVGARRGKPVILTIQANRMAGDGHQFFTAANNVWLTDHVPPDYLNERLQESTCVRLES